jgi:hypothetical protein
MERKNSLWNAPNFTWIETDAELEKRKKEYYKHELEANYGDASMIVPFTP